MSERNDRPLEWHRFLGPYAMTYWKMKRGEPSDWSWFFSLTVAHDVSAQSLNRMLGVFCAKVASNAGDHVLVAFAIAPQPMSGRMHAHGVLSFGPGRGLRPEEGERIWRAVVGAPGDPEIRQYEPGGKCILYTANHADIILKVSCPEQRVCRRSGGCSFAGDDRWSASDYTG